jgi:hypothetical protein
MFGKKSLICHARVRFEHFIGHLAPCIQKVRALAIVSTVQQTRVTVLPLFV